MIDQQTQVTPEAHSNGTPTTETIGPEGSDFGRGFGPERIDEIVVDDSLQVRHRLDLGTVQKYAEAYRAGVVLPAVKVALFEGTIPMLVDGWHRLAALRKLGIGTVEVEVVAQKATMREIRWLAAEANTKHGLPLTRKEMENVFKAYVQAGKHWKKGRLKPWREISRELGGRSHNTIGSWFKKHFPKIYRNYQNEELSKKTGGLMHQATESETSFETFKRHLNTAVLLGIGTGDVAATMAALADAQRVIRDGIEGSGNPNEDF